MRGMKLTVAIISIIQGVLAILGGIGITIMGLMGAAFVNDIAGDLNFSGTIAVFFAIIGAIALAIGIIFLVLGIKFCSHKPNKGIAITLLVFYIIGAFSVIGGVETLVAGLISILCVVFLIIYLVKLGKHQPATFNAQDPFDQSQPQEHGN